MDSFLLIGALGRKLPRLNFCRHRSLSGHRLTISSTDEISFRRSIPDVRQAVGVLQDNFALLNCALGRNRTCDPLDRNQMLYPLSYKRKNKILLSVNRLRKTHLNMQ